ncbi:hypothetical protein DL769_001049 [Monosporascus sp. CRB-8-3]|nr:hypothetical protein DL769_001049 [Monosporascus sp. CRB-8-3]
MLNLPECAVAFQDRGITALLYHPRNTGASGGHPRNDIDPPQSVGDISDALTHLLTLPSVIPMQVGLFGISFGGSVALSASALDTRLSFTIAVAPLTDFDFISPVHRRRVLDKCMKDRESQVLGNEPFKVPVINKEGENAVGFGHGVDKERYAKLVQEGREIAPGHVNSVTLMTYYKIAMWTPWPLWNRIGSGNTRYAGKSTPNRIRGALFVVPEKDQMSYPALQRKCYHNIKTYAEFRKHMVEVAGAGHEDVLGEKHLPGILEDITSFIKGVLGGD